MKPSKYWKSMDEIAEYLDDIKPRLTTEEFDILKTVMGFGDQEGDFIEIPKLGKIDKSIAYIIQSLNGRGFITLASCSGVMSEHIKWTTRKAGYLSFLDTGESVRSLVSDMAKKLNLPYIEGETYLKPSVAVQVAAESDEELLKIWNSIFEILNNTQGDDLNANRDFGR